MGFFVLFECASGYGLFERKEFDQIAEQHDDFQQTLLDFGKFSSLVSLKAFVPFMSAADALGNINCVSEGLVHETLKTFLENNFPKSKKKVKNELGVSEEKLGGAIQDACPGISCVKNQTVHEILRAIRLHFHKTIEALKDGDLEKAQLGLGHSYSRCKVKFNVNRADNMITQSIALLDQLNKDINTFAMRVKEWYSYHYPELALIVKDNILYAKVAYIIQSKDRLQDDVRERLEEVTMDPIISEKILSAIKSSMGQDISPVDLINICNFSERVIAMDAYRTEIEEYLAEKMDNVAPNLKALIGDTVGARLISHAGSLTNLAKYPASTVQILGAEKALFRALKTRGNTPKYGLIYRSTFIGRASTGNKGRISRYLANKCSIASRIDCFSDSATTKFGTKLKEQVEDRLKFYETGDAPQTNADAMKEVLDSLTPEERGATGKKRKRSSSSADISMDDVSEKSEKRRKKDKKEKKDKKDKKDKKEKKDKKKK